MQRFWIAELPVEFGFESRMFSEVDFGDGSVSARDSRGFLWTYNGTNGTWVCHDGTVATRVDGATEDTACQFVAERDGRNSRRLGEWSALELYESAARLYLWSGMFRTYMPFFADALYAYRDDPTVPVKAMTGDAA